MSQKIVRLCITIMLVSFTAYAGMRPVKERRTNDLTLVESVDKFFEDLKNARLFIEEAYRIKSPKMLDNAKEKLAHANRVLEHIGRMAIVGYAPQEITAYEKYAKQYLKSLSLANLIPNLHQQREDLKPAYRKAEADLGMQKKKEIKPQVISPSAKRQKTGPKKRVTFAPGTKPEEESKNINFKKGK